MTRRASSLDFRPKARSEGGSAARNRRREIEPQWTHGAAFIRSRSSTRACQVHTLLGHSDHRQGRLPLLLLLAIDPVENLLHDSMIDKASSSSVARLIFGTSIAWKPAPIHSMRSRPCTMMCARAGRQSVSAETGWHVSLLQRCRECRRRSQMVWCVLRCVGRRVRRQINDGTTGQRLVHARNAEVRRARAWVSPDGH